MSRTKKIAYTLTATAITLGAGLGVAGVASAAFASDATSTSVAGGITAAHPGDGRGPGGGADHAAELATALGVDQADVAAALKAFHEENKPSTPPAEGSKVDRGAMRDALAASLAESLGLDVSDVTAALDEVQSATQAERSAALQTRLDAAVADGTLTQAEADAVTKAIEAGVIGGGRQ